VVAEDSYLSRHSLSKEKLIDAPLFPFQELIVALAPESLAVLAIFPSRISI